MRYDVVGLGTAAHDLIGVAGDEPQLGRKQPLARWVESGGGPVPTALVAVARLGGRACMVGAVGDDRYGARIIADLAAEGVDTAGMQVCPGDSHIAFALAEPGSDRRSIWFRTDPAVLAAVRVERGMITAGRALHLDTYTGDAGLQAARWAREADIPVMIDAERVRECTIELLPLCTWLVVSANFGRAVTGEGDPAAAASALRSRYDALVVVTAGERGSWCAVGDERFHTPAFPVTPLDTTGCGDVFHGGLLFALLRGDPPRQALRFASAVAALKTRAYGGRAGIPTLAEVEAWMRA
ncbi:sugar kinase [Oscillochloris sp. ZM17-4]|uniref:PfkB family carbohydrate kinase n=1 Tax=Oscillochloris sp. ZM17-4 TaxID=2866714 RepID=UPI001C738669|nr:PfkB family carbohydrate kinase [Oscillochloris sp. ZM17-4]MBX0327571.1 sugar kinase [Oscillochloris sp. ZM17-4]